MPSRTQRAPSPDSGDDSFIVIPTMGSGSSKHPSSPATISFPQSFSGTATTKSSCSGNSSSAPSLNESATPGPAATQEPVLVAVQDMIAAFTANMKAAMLESEGRTAIRFSESLQAIQAETGEREERAVKNTLSACRADMEGYYHTALAAAEARSAESFGRVFERLDRLEKTAIADGKKSAKTHRELRNSIASAEERATVAMTEQRANIESYIDEQLQNNLEEVAAQVNKRFDVHNREWVGMKDSQEKLEDRLNALEGRQADLDAELYDLKVTKESLESEQKSVREMQEVVKAALKDLKKEQDTARDQTIELEARVDKAEKRVILVEEKQTASEETQPVFALNTDLGDAEARICKLEVQFGDIPKDHQDVWKAIEGLEVGQGDAEDKITKYDSRVQDLEKTIGNVQEKHSSLEGQVHKLDADFCNWRTKKQLSILDNDAEIKNKVSKAQNTLEEHEKKLRNLRSDIEHEATQRRKLQVKTTGMTLAFANDTSVSGIGKSQYPAIKTWLDELAARPATAPDVRCRAIHYSAWLANNV
ncbi:hypothetical protein A1Q2_06686 [Trichosporon asahii var. asahii CBS 8904]|uniref:Uncharacterized protein n=1 Tax=Trichosporon asahii var. asahii (strain CBS 8904) TaxID=1220162 RepID=K1VQD3_TRIAC|nr:hypothetical protein A1Q2_06686 [Trichosporon asahii var. asahii CBS 8904]